MIAVKIDWKKLTLRIPDELHRALKIRAAEEDRPMTEIIERLIREYLVRVTP